MTMPIERKAPHLGPAPDYSKAFYPDPPSHDFNVWLIMAEMMRRHRGAPAPLQVRFGFIEGQLGIVDFSNRGVLAGSAYRCGLSRDYHDTMLANVLRPAIAMLGAVELPPIEAPFNLDTIADHCEYDYHIGALVDAGKQGVEIPKWQVPQWAHDEVDAYLGSRRPVVITLREAPAQPERNSQVEEWIKFAHSIKEQHSVLFLRDTAKATEPLSPFDTWPRASTNVYVRAALYQRALVNLMVCNGPNTWVIFSDAPYLIFKQLVPALPQWDHGQPKGWRDQDHMEVGDQYAWATPQQRMTWLDDTCENISTAFATFIAG